MFRLLWDLHSCFGCYSGSSQFRLWLCRSFQELQCILHFGCGDFIAEFSPYESVGRQASKQWGWVFGFLNVWMALQWVTLHPNFNRISISSMHWWNSALCLCCCWLCLSLFSPINYNSLGTDLHLPLLPLKEPWYRPLALIYLLGDILMGEEGLVWCNGSGKLQIALV